MVFFSYLIVQISLRFMATLIGSGGDFPRWFMISIIPSHPIHLLTCLSLPLPRNIIPRRAFLSLPIPLPHHICPPLVSLYLYLTLLLPNNFRPPHAHLSITISLPHNIFPPRATLYISIPFRLPHPPCLYQRFPRCHSYPNMIQIIQFIYLLIPIVSVSLLWNCWIGSKRMTNGEMV